MGWRLKSRKSLYKALSGERTPPFDTILKMAGGVV
jgi:DNA-binding phage protein